MASGGLPPTKQMPPPRGWTPGASLDPAQNNHDEIIANNQWQVSSFSYFTDENSSFKTFKVLTQHACFSKMQVTEMDIFLKFSEINGELPKQNWTSIQRQMWTIHQLLEFFGYRPSSEKIGWHTPAREKILSTSQVQFLKKVKTYFSQKFSYEYKEYQVV